MSRRRPSTPAKFLITYLVVFTLMLGWWLVLQVSTDVGVPVVTVLVAYAAPAAAWVAVSVLVGEKRHRV